MLKEIWIPCSYYTTISRVKYRLEQHVSNNSTDTKETNSIIVGDDQFLYSDAQVGWKRGRGREITFSTNFIAYQSLLSFALLKELTFYTIILFWNLFILSTIFYLIMCRCEKSSCSLDYQLIIIITLIIKLTFEINSGLRDLNIT